MRVSAYEIILPLIGKDEREIPGQSLLVNGLYGAMDVVPEEIAAALARGEAESLAPPIRERLLARGHITRKDEAAGTKASHPETASALARPCASELAIVKLLGRIQRKIFSASAITPVILPTYDCNFRCPYCYEGHRLKRGTEWLSQKMRPAMIQAVFAALAKQRDKGRRIKDITLYGGEPLMAENREVVEAICAHAKDMGLEISIVTNGYDLDSYWDLLAKFPVSDMQLTVDGVGVLNDRRRRHRDGKPTYERILQNAGEAVKRGIDIQLRVNVDRENLSSIPALLQDLEAMGLRGKKELTLYFAPVTFVHGSPAEIGYFDILAALREAGESMEEAAGQVNILSTMAAKVWSIMEKKQPPEFSPAFCGAETGMFVIAPDGKIFPCWDFVGIDREAVGYTDETAGEFVLGLPTALWRTRTVDLMEPCQTCPYLFLCRGGCAAQAKRETGSCFKRHCGEIKKIADFVMSRLAGRKWEEESARESESGLIELTLSLAEPVACLTEGERKRIMETASQEEIFSIAKKTGFFA